MEEVCPWPGKRNICQMANFEHFSMSARRFAACQHAQASPPLVSFSACELIGYTEPVCVHLWFYELLQSANPMPVSTAYGCPSFPRKRESTAAAWVGIRRC